LVIGSKDAIEDAKEIVVDLVKYASHICTTGTLKRVYLRNPAMGRVLRASNRQPVISKDMRDEYKLIKANIYGDRTPIFNRSSAYTRYYWNSKWNRGANSSSSADSYQRVLLRVPL
jgi:hypothetical protein